jgi:hypothetical protein
MSARNLVRFSCDFCETDKLEEYLPSDWATIKGTRYDKRVNDLIKYEYHMCSKCVKTLIFQKNEESKEKRYYAHPDIASNGCFSKKWFVEGHINDLERDIKEAQARIELIKKVTTEGTKT